MKEKIREFIKNVKKNDDRGVRDSLKSILKEKVVERLNKVRQD